MKKRIGLALSGGGMRAAVFHLGVLKALAKHKMLAQVSHISTVSGASICMGLIYGCNRNCWPNDDVFLTSVLPKIKAMITQKDIQWNAILRLIVEPYYWDKKVNLLANVMEKRWKVSGCLQDIFVYPKWTINTTAYETGKDFRMDTTQMGSLQSGYVVKPHFMLTHAMAASAGFPVFIGPYKLKTKDYHWVDDHANPIIPQDQILHLWDGGVYDNMGLDPLFHIDEHPGLSDDIDYLIISNASGNIEHQSRHMSFSIQNLKRLLDINMDQVESLKSRSVMNYFQMYHRGLYIKINAHVDEILDHCQLTQEQKDELLVSALNDQDVKKVADYKTTLTRVKPEDFDMIAKHGETLTECLLRCFA